MWYEARDGATQQARHVLVIEHNAALHEALIALLEEHGYDVISATSGAAALDALRSSPVDLVLLDTTLPDMSGYDLYDELRRMPETGRPRVILTAKQGEARLTDRATDADDFVSKPFDDADLLQRIGGLLYRPAQQRTAAR